MSMLTTIKHAILNRLLVVALAITVLVVGLINPEKVADLIDH